MTLVLISVTFSASFPVTHFLITSLSFLFVVSLFRRFFCALRTDLLLLYSLASQFSSLQGQVILREEGKRREISGDILFPSSSSSLCCGVIFFALLNFIFWTRSYLPSWTKQHTEQGMHGSVLRVTLPFLPAMNVVMFSFS